MINESWDDFLNEQFNQDYFKKLSSFLTQEYLHKTIYPPKVEVFSSFYFTDLDKVKVVILGQDPYHQENQACGLAFAVKPNVALPPSLINIYKEIEDDLNVKMSNNGYLVKWAKQGVMLLNAVLTVEQSRANSHRGKGWEIFTDNVIAHLNKQDQPIVFLLWGNNAKEKIRLLDNPKHLVLTSVHPSPLSAHRGFWVVNIFQKLMSF